MCYPPAAFPPATTCARDQGTTRAVLDQKPVRFYSIGPLDVVEVIGVPALVCSTCQERTYDVHLLARIEALLKRRTGEEGPYRLRYAFAELAAELNWPSAVVDAGGGGFQERAGEHQDLCRSSPACG